MIGVTLDRPVEHDGGTVAGFLDTFFAKRVAQASMHGEDYGRLWSAARDAASGGKRIRPALVLAAHRAFAGAQTESAVRLAAAFELLHTAFVIHDDVIDHDLVRRGAPNVAGRFALEGIARGFAAGRANDYGEASAILAGDLLISGAHRLVAELDAPPAVRGALLELVDECVFLAAAGEHADVRHAAGATPCEGEILAMIEHKTASYSFSAPLQAGALLGGATADTVDRLGEIGRHLGVAFQLRDDVLGVYGMPEFTGKSVLGDLREGKETLLIAYARGHAAWSEVAADFGRGDLDVAGAARLRTAIEASGARSRVERLIAERCDAAMAAVSASLLPGTLGDQLAATARECVERAR
jgi:geranylgeranyl pyrophosphate synthase